ncbi:sulfurtransferase TusA [Aidingimonas lacisalsi]|uniref:sulfurtransferase TusA n=1 Tax=Aidingimonas lacisalsi TaxID=2604086 RepID=UPI0011D1AE93|nr:sulfurtransferase TusA [Aidingimonas lacisalsi]
MDPMSDTIPASDAELDTSGLYCPEPVMMMHNRVRELQTGDVLKVIATDPATTRDIPKFCSFLGHELVHQSEDQGTYLYFIRLG